MAIDKIIPIRLDKSSDFKLVPKTSMVDALNMLITENESSGDNGSTGNLGVLKNIKGNDPISYLSGHNIAAGNAKIIGSVTDTKLKIVYFFVWHTIASEHGVYAYDQIGKLPISGGTKGKIVRIHKSALYAFPEHGYVKGNIIYTSQTRLDDSEIKPGAKKDFEKDAILYFTDNTNEPRKINVYQAMLGEDSSYELDDKIDFITACPKTPLTPIEFEFMADSSRTTSNFKSGPGFQFAYQFISKDGVESAISPYSDIAFSPGIINQGGLTVVDHSLHNVCILKIPNAGAEIKNIRILARQFNNPELVVLDEVSNTEIQENWVLAARAYYFYNDRIVRGVSNNEVNKQFDNLPRKAQAQSVVDNRLMYGNYLEGFDNVKTQCSASVSFENRGVELIDLKVRLIPAISEQQWAYDVEYGAGNIDTTDNLGQSLNQSSGARNKSAGYIIDCQEMPIDIAAGSVYNITVQISPNNNFHVYQATDSYHQSRHRGAFQQGLEYQIDYSMLPEAGNWSGEGSINQASPYGGEEGQWVNNEGNDNPFYGHQGLGRSGAEWIGDRIPNPILAGEGMYSTSNAEFWGIPYSGDNFGVTGNSDIGNAGTGPDAPEWKTIMGASLSSGETSKKVNFGTSAGNPLIIKGGQLEFSCTIEALIDIDSVGRDALTSAIAQALSGQDITWEGYNAFEVVNDEVEPLYSLDLGGDIFDGKQIPEGNYLSKLIVGAVEDEPGESTIYKAPLGHFIVNKADVTFSLERDAPFADIDPKYEMVRLCISSIENVETYSVFKKKFYNSPWFAFSKDYLTGSGSVFNQNDFFADTSYGFAGASGTFNQTLFQYEEQNNLEDWDYIFNNIVDDFNPNDLDISGDFGVTGVEIAGLETSFLAESMGTPVGVDAAPYAALLANVNQLQEQRFLGYLDFTQDGVFNQFFRFNKSQYQNKPRLSGVKELSPFSVVDGEGGMGGNLSHNLENSPGSVSLSSHPRRMRFNERLVNSELTGSTQDQVIRTIRVAGPEFTGTINSRYIPSLDSLVQNNVGGGGAIQQLQSTRTFIPLMQGSPIEGLNTGDDFQFPYSFYSTQAVDWPFVIDFNQKHSYIELLGVPFLFIPGGGEAVFDPNSSVDRTFKSNADHDFGIIYYDERGRHGFVNHLKTVHVPGYSSAERLGAIHGRSVINLSFSHDPPKWAHYYKLAYTKNTSVQNFIQYSAGGAFREDFEGSGAEVSSTLIYVSLNYLQESSMSYVAEWGARNPQGGLSMFKAIDGVSQKLRVISAYTDGENRDFFYNYEFDIVNMVLLGDSENPLTTTPETHPEMQGEFVILKDNSNADGFNWASVFDGSHKWGNNCIVELFTPARDRDEDTRFYYEIGDTYNINNPETDNPTHSVSSVVLDKGDVWWRRVPVNLREYDGGEFTDLILNGDPDDSLTSNFKPYYLETETASDLFKADATLIGRPNIILEDAIETIREASITYSGQSNPNSSKINYSSFNLTLSNFKGLQEEFGDINYMCNMEGDVFVIQSDRCTLVPASKTLFSDVQGSSTVAASKSPLGQERVFAGRAGCDNNPESVVQVGAYVYFAHKNLGRVYRFNPANGIQEISEQGMASYFRGIFKDAMDKSVTAGNFINYDDVRVVGGFDPVNEEYLLTVLDPETYGVTEGTGGGGFPEGGGEVIEDLTTINSLEQQLKNVMTAFLTATQPDGVTPAFDITTLPQELQAFYNTPLTDGRDITAFDGNENDVFDAGEIVSMSDIQVGVQESLNNFLVSELDITLEAMVEIINRADVTTTDRVVLYVNTMLQRMVNIDHQLKQGVVKLNDSRKSRESKHNQSALDASVPGFENPYWKNTYDFNVQVEEGWSGTSDLLVEAYEASGGDFTDPALLEAITALQAAQDAWGEESGYTNKPSRIQTLKQLWLSAEYHTLLQKVFSGYNVSGDDKRVGVNEISSNTPMYSWGVESTGEYLTPFTLANNLGGVLEEFKIYLRGLKDARMSIGGLTEAEAIQEIVPEEFFSSYIAANPFLQASLQTILQGIATSNGVEVSGVTGSMLDVWAGSQTSNGNGAYNSVAEAVAAEGISTNQIQDFLQQIELVSASLPSGGFDILKWKSDINGDGQIGSADLLFFLATFGEQQLFPGDITWLI
jgi:hypothetical protein